MPRSVRVARSLRSFAVSREPGRPESSTLVVAELEDKWIRFMRLADGVELAQSAVEWDVPYTECPMGTTRSTEPLVIKSSEHQFLAITGTNPDIEVVAVEANIGSENILSSGSVVPLMTSRRELLAWHLVERRMLNFGLLQHNRRDILPFCLIGVETNADGEKGAP